MQLPPKPKLMTEFTDIEGARNPSYLNSLYLGFERGIFRAPSSFLRLCGWPVATIILCLLYLVVGTAIWLVCRVLIIVQGMTGFLRLRRVPDSKSALTGF